jgi:tetratricopeptide (TPR) repeat protein
LHEGSKEVNTIQNERPESYKQSLRELHAGRAEQAALLLEPLYEANPNDAEYALHLGGAYVLMGRYDEAREILEKTAVLAPENPNVWVNLAAARLGLLETSNEVQQDGAVAAYQQALAAHPETPNVHYMLGLIYRTRQDNLRAAAHFTRALEQDPNDRDAQMMLRAIARDSAK